MKVAIIGGGPASLKTTSRGLHIAVVGGGFTGLTAAYELTKRGHRVTLFEASKELGGLAFGFKGKDWDWSLEYAYHHWFTNDHAILSLIKELGLEDKLIIKRPITANYVPVEQIRTGGERTKLSPDSSASGINLYKQKSARAARESEDGSQFSFATKADYFNQIYQLDSPRYLFQFPGLSLTDKLRTAALLAFLKLNPFWKPLENLTAKDLVLSIGGKRAYEVLWEPLLIGKFSDYADSVSAAWFWARIKKRTSSLVYVDAGFRTVIDALAAAIKKNGGEIITSAPVESIKQVLGNRYYVVGKKQKKIFDTVLLTIPTPLANKLIPIIPNTSTESPLSIPHLFAQTLILETHEPILKDIYWLNVTDRSFPFLAVVAHTNFMDKKHYGGKHLTYFGNYLPAGHKYLSMTKEELLKEFMPFIKRLTKSGLEITNSFMFVGPFAQPVHELHYSQKAPKFETAIANVYLANMDSIYPWDRGTNYAVELGQKAANNLLRETT